MAMEQIISHMACSKGKDVATTFLPGSMPLSMVQSGKDVSVTFIKGKDETKRFLGSLGFVENETISIVTKLGGNVIVNVKGTRVAISQAMASRIYTT